MADETTPETTPVEVLEPIALKSELALKGGLPLRPIGYDLYCTRNNPIDTSNNITVRHYDLYKKTPETQSTWVLVASDVIPPINIPGAYSTDNGGQGFETFYANQAIVQGPYHAGMTAPTATDASVPVYYYARDMSQDGNWGDTPTYGLDVNRLIKRGLYRTNDLTQPAVEVACDGMVPNLDHVLFMGKGRLAYQKNKFRDDNYPYFPTSAIDGKLYICNFDPMVLKSDSDGVETIIGVARIPVQYFDPYEGEETGTSGGLSVSYYLPGDDTKNPSVYGNTPLTGHVREWTLKRTQYAFLGETGLALHTNRTQAVFYPIDGVFAANGLPPLSNATAASATGVDSDMYVAYFRAAPLGQANYTPRYNPQVLSGDNHLHLAYITVLGAVTNVHYLSQSDQQWVHGQWNPAEPHEWWPGSWSGPYGSVSGTLNLIPQIHHMEIVYGEYNPDPSEQGAPFTRIYFNQDSVPLGDVWMSIVVSRVPDLKTQIAYNPGPPPVYTYKGPFKDLTAADLAVFTAALTNDFAAGNYNGNLLANSGLTRIRHDHYWYDSAYEYQYSGDASVIVSCTVTGGGGLLNFDTILSTSRGFYTSDRIVAVTGADGEKVCGSINVVMAYSTDYGNTFQNCASNTPNLFYHNLLSKRVGVNQSLFIVLGGDYRVGDPYFIEPKYPDMFHDNGSNFQTWYSSDGGKKWTSFIQAVEPAHIIVAADDKIVMVVPKTAPTFGPLYPLVETVPLYTEYHPDFTTVRYCEVLHNITSITSVEFETKYLDIDATYIWHASDKIGGFTPDTTHPNRIYINSLIDPVDVPYFSTEVRVTYMPAANDTVDFPTAGWDPPGMSSYIYEAIELDTKTKQVTSLGDLPKEWGSPIGDWGADQPSYNSFSILVDPDTIYGKPAERPKADPLIAYRERDSVGTPMATSIKVQRAGVPLRFGVFASGGTPPSSWNTPTPLPSWLSFSASGIFSGTPPSTSYETSVECVVTDTSVPPLTATTTVFISIIR